MIESWRTASTGRLAGSISEPSAQVLETIKCKMSIVQTSVNLLNMGDGINFRL